MIDQSQEIRGGGANEIEGFTVGETANPNTCPAKDGNWGANEYDESVSRAREATAAGTRARVWPIGKVGHTRIQQVCVGEATGTRACVRLIGEVGHKRIRRVCAGKATRAQTRVWLI